MPPSLRNIATFRVRPTTTASLSQHEVSLKQEQRCQHRRLQVIVAHGSVVGFHVPHGRMGGIVNAANEGCLGGGGVDGAITHAGGPTLAHDRLALPILNTTTMMTSTTRTTTTNRGSNPGRRIRNSGMETRHHGSIRCRTGSAVMTGPGNYGELKVPFVIHAVGPDYHEYDDGDSIVPDRLLQSAYQTSLDLCQEYQITDVAFALLSSGVYRGRRNLKDILSIGIKAIQDWSHKKDNDDDGFNQLEMSLKTVTLCGFSDPEVSALTEICTEILELDKGGD